MRRAHVEQFLPGAPPQGVAVAAVRLVALVALAALAVLASGCHTAAPRHPDRAGATAKSGGLVVRVTDRVGKPAGTAHVTVRADDAHAPGALGYDLRFGDGTAAQNVVPQYCMASPGAQRRVTWHFTHRYPHRGTFHLSVRVSANCAPTATTARLTVRVG